MIVPFFVSIMFVLRKDRETSHREKETCIEAAECVEDAGSMFAIGGRMEGRAEVVFPTYTLMLSVS